MIDRRQFLKISGGLTAGSLARLPLLAKTLSGEAADALKLTIAPVTVDLSPQVRIKTVGYNGTAPGPVLRMREGAPVQVVVKNATAHAELVHWHGLHIPSNIDGSEEEGTPMIPAGESRRYAFTPAPSGSRWYHTHTMAHSNLQSASYTGQFGFLYIEPKSEPGDYDQEVFLAVHHWEPSLMQ